MSTHVRSSIYYMSSDTWDTIKVKQLVLSLLHQGEATREWHKVLNDIQGPNTNPPKTMGATINNESTAPEQPT